MFSGYRERQGKEQVIGELSNHPAFIIG